MENKISKLIQKVQGKFGEDAFEITRDYDLETEKKTISYNEGNLTKNYVKFLTDLLNEEFVPITEDVILAFGETIKSSESEFQQSIKEKQSSIKKLQEGVFIHTNMSKSLMENILVGIVKAAQLKIKFNQKIEGFETLDLDSEVKNFTNISEVSRKDPRLFRHLVRTGQKELFNAKLRENKLHNTWTFEKLKNVALQYQTLGEFKSSSPQAYIYSKRSGFFSEITHHFHKNSKNTKK